jgi:hypothetical protein
VDEREADERYTRLVADLSTLHEWLEAVGESHWARWLDSARQQIVAHDGNGLTHLLRAYGGMGSLNDLPMSRSMSVLKARAYDDATALLADLVRPERPS